MTSKFVRYAKNDPSFNHACASEPKIGTISVLGTNPDCPEDRVTVDFFEEDFGYSPSDDYILTRFMKPELLEETTEAHPVLKTQRLRVASYPVLNVAVDSTVNDTPVDTKNVAGHKVVSDIYNEEMAAAMERIKARIEGISGISVESIDADDAFSSTINY